MQWLSSLQWLDWAQTTPTQPQAGGFKLKVIFSIFPFHQVFENLKPGRLSKAGVVVVVAPPCHARQLYLLGLALEGLPEK